MSEIIDVTPETLDKHGFFCKMSARKTKAWQDKRDWLLARMDEGLELRLLGDKDRGFIEFIPGDFAWRGIENAGDLMVVHCLWVVGKSKDQGHARALITEARRRAQALGFNGLAVLASSGNWLAKPDLFTHFGFATVETDNPFSLMVDRWSPGPAPRLSGGWEDKAAACGPGLTVIRSAQCPYLEDAAGYVRAFAKDGGLDFSDEVLTTAAELRQRAPSAYGTYALVKDGRLVATHYLLPKDLEKIV